MSLQEFVNLGLSLDEIDFSRLFFSQHELDEAMILALKLGRVFALRTLLQNGANPRLPHNNHRIFSILEDKKNNYFLFDSLIEELKNAATATCLV